MKALKLGLIIFVSTLLGFFSAISFAQISSNKSLSSKSKYSDKFIEQVLERVKKDYVDEKSNDQLYESAASGIISSLDPHSSFLNSDDLKEMSIHTKGEFGGVGIEITTEMSVAKVVSAIDDTPAFRAGIKSGDYIIRIDGKSSYGMKIDEVVKKIRGKPNTPVKLTIFRKGEKEPFEKTIIRRIIKIKPIKAYRFNDVAYIKITTFSEKTFESLQAELKKLKTLIGEKNLKGLVLDLRNNPGGLLDQAINVSAGFLDKGKAVVSIKSRAGLVKEFQTDSNQSLVPNLPVVVLINEGSASASEIVAGALQDHKRAVIMGTKSFGKGSVQTIIPLDANQGAIKMTTALYYTPSGRSIQATGIEPDIELTQASIEKQKTNERESEADLKGHIEIEIQQAIEKSTKTIFEKNKISDDNIDVYQKDYQLARALDLIRGIGLYNSIIKK
ncbi:MAG: S41 family peptidase [Proteobacteria bacterium]|jgi:carboxyl-terminal processing protease|nr:S41 family peptidase [Pseudomonadota bacterium]NCA28063.1 S41 family peptidase [Pseudomonadota bacterium]